MREKVIGQVYRAAMGKAERREANRAAWAASPLNANNMRKELIEVAAPEIKNEPNNDARGSSSLAELRRVMADSSIGLHQRISCAEAIIGYEISPGALAGIDPTEEVASSAYRFLKLAVGAEGTPPALRLRCLRALLSVEAARASTRNVKVENEQRRRLLTAVLHGETIRLLRERGLWETTVAAGEVKTVLPDDLPRSWLEGDWPPADLVQALEQTDASAAFAAELRGMAETPSATKPQKS